MIKRLTKSDFRDEFFRADRRDNFSYEGLGVLYDYLEDIDPDYDLDVIALCCEYSEDSIDEVLKNYNCETINEFCDKTLVIWHDDVNVLYHVF